jgi:glutaredoxin-related protein
MERIKKAKGTSNVNKVTIYETNTCPWCMKTKEFLKENNVKFVK